ncbi:MAG: hypothetical protein V4489_08705, partial [Chlamydiota bacterium]
MNAIEQGRIQYYGDSFTVVAKRLKYCHKRVKMELERFDSQKEEGVNLFLRLEKLIKEKIVPKEESILAAKTAFDFDDKLIRRSENLKKQVVALKVGAERTGFKSEKKAILKTEKKAMDILQKT